MNQRLRDMHLSDIPPEIIHTHIFKFLTTEKQLVTLSLVCQQWNQVIDVPIVVDTETPQIQQRVSDTGSALELVLVQFNPIINNYWNAKMNYEKHRLSAKYSLIHIAKGATFEFEKMQGRQEDYKEFLEGYSYAFGSAPYGVRTSTGLFQELNDCLFGGTSDDNIQHLEIYSWVDQPWSSFFDAGLEWWGVFISTIYNKKTGTMCCVAASTTD